MQPNLITTIRLILVFIILITDYFGLYFLALLFILLAYFSDFLDGYISRKYNKRSHFGVYYDHFVDKIFVHGLLIYYLHLNLLPFSIVALLLLRDYLALGFRQYAESYRKTIASVVSGKAKFILQGVLLILLAITRFFPLSSQAILAYAIFVVLWTWYSLFDMFRKNKDITRKIKTES